MAFANRSAAHFDNGNFSASIAGIKRGGHGTMSADILQNDIF